ncbi:hypothetical protein EOPP23_03460 [Endozoicomonas sp. OPT23]|nr:hypothetical protein [Endozoicomonas sp. OPT23]
MWLISSLFIISSVSLFSTTAHSLSDNIPTIVQHQFNEMEVANEIANLSTTFVYNLDTQNLQQALRFITSSNTRIRSIRITETESQKNLLTFYRPPYQQGSFDTPVPDSVLQYPKILRSIVHQGRVIARLELYYDNLSRNEQIPQALTLSIKEQKWLKEHPVISVGVLSTGLPLIGKGTQGNPDGIMADYLQKLKKQTNVDYNYVYGSFSELLTAFKRGEIDLLPSIFYDDSRNQLGLFSAPTHSLKVELYAAANNSDIKNFSNFKNKTVGVFRGHVTITMLKEQFPSLRLITYDSMNAGINALLNGEIEGLAGPDLIIDYLINKSGGINIRKITRDTLPSIDIHWLIQNKHQPLMSIIDKFLLSMSSWEKNQIKSKYQITQPSKSNRAISLEEQSISSTILTLAALFFIISTILLLIAKSMSSGLMGSTASFGSRRFSKLVIFSIALIITLSGAISYFVLQHTLVYQKADIQQQLKLSVTSADQKMMDVFNLRNGLIRHISRKKEIQSLTKKIASTTATDFELYEKHVFEFTSFWNRYVNLFPKHEVVVTDLKGNVLVGQPSEEIESIYEQYLRRTTGSLNLWQYPISNQQDTNSRQPEEETSWINYSTNNIVDKSGEVQAVIISKVNYSEKLQVFLENVRLTKKISITPVGIDPKNSQLLVIQNKHISQKHPLYNFYLNSSHNDSTQTSPLLSYSHDGKDFFVLALWNPTLGTGFIAEVNQSDILAGYNTVKYGLILVLVLVFAFVIPYILFMLNLGRQANKKLMDSNAELDEKVNERTQKLSDLEEQSRLILESIGQGLFRLNDEGCINFINPVALTLLGYRSDEIIGRSITSLGHSITEDDGYQDQVEHTIHQILNGNQVLTQLYGFFRAKNGNVLPIEFCCNPVYRHKRIIGWVIVFSDISDRLEMDKNLRKALDKAEQASKAKSDFLANMSHEIRTPMNSILGMSQLVLQTRLETKQRNYIEKVNRSAHSLLGIINDILDFSKIEAGKLSLEQTPFVLDSVLNDVRNIVSFNAEEKGLELLFDLPVNLPRLVGDPLRLSQILLNLGNNAVKFTDQGEILISIRVTEQSNSKIVLHFSVKDTGIGLSQKQIDKLFQSFTQADTSTTRKYGGTGLGLAISHRLVSMMNGTIWVESEQNLGANFQFSLTFNTRMNDEATNSLEYLNQERVLVVDDNPTAREICRNMLHQFGMVTTEAATGDEALRLILTAESSQNPYSLIIMDWKMPGLDGINAARLIFQQCRKEPPHCILMTAFGQDLANTSDEGSNIRAYLPKPLTASSLLNTISRVFGRSLPFNSQPLTGSNKTEDAINHLSGAEILLVEDNEVNQELAIDLLESNGMKVTVAENGLQALNALESKTFDGVLMDCQMPVLDGYEATRRIRKNLNWANLPVLAMTANAMAGDRAKALEAGMNDHIAKPINFEDMLTKMAFWIEPREHITINKGLNESSAVSNDEYPWQILASINTDTGLGICQDRTSLYIRLLGKFRQNQSSFCQEYLSAIEDGDLELAKRLAHTLKGVSANIGAHQLSQQAMNLEQVTGTDISEEACFYIINSLRQTIKKVAQEIDAFLQLTEQDEPEQQSDHNDTEHVDISGLYEQLKTLIENDDTEALDICGAMTSQLKHEDTNREALLKIRAALEEYDFELALERLNKSQWPL